MNILYSKVISGCESSCIRKLIQDMMDCIKSKYILSDSEEYEFRLILNELIANGTVHGNKRLCDKTITAQIESIGGIQLILRLRMKVLDLITNVFLRMLILVISTHFRKEVGA